MCYCKKLVKNLLNFERYKIKVNISFFFNDFSLQNISKIRLSYDIINFYNF